MHILDWVCMAFEVGCTCMTFEVICGVVWCSRDFFFRIDSIVCDFGLVWWLRLGLITVEVFGVLERTTNISPVSRGIYSAVELTVLAL